MVVKMMKWRPWPPLSSSSSSEKFEVKIVVHQLKGLDSATVKEYGKLDIQIKWIGSKGNGLNLNSLRKNVTRNFIKEGSLREEEEDGVVVVEWNEEILNVCNFIAFKEASFYPWEITFSVFNGSNNGQSDKVAALFTGSLNLSNLISSKDQQKDIEVNVPLDTLKSNNGSKTTLCLYVSLLKLKNTQEHMETIQGPPVAPFLRSTSRKVVPAENNESLSSTKTKVRFLRALSTRKSKKEYREEDGSDGKIPVIKSADSEHIHRMDTDTDTDTESHHDDDLEFDHGGESESHLMNKSFSYETLIDANYKGQLLLYSSTSISSEDEDLMYFGNPKKDEEKCCIEIDISPITSSSIHGPISSILPWRKRKLSFKPFKEKGEPLLRKDYGIDGGDDIDHDRRQFSSSDESTFKILKAEEDAVVYRSSVSEFGDDSFAVGIWEKKDILNRDGNMKLQTNVFFGSIDQRSEKADGESACTSLVAVIAEWFQSNTNEMPIKSQFDRLIRDGSFEWRNLCENDTYIKQFPDKHFDLDTVLESKTRSISVVHENSYVGFFHPEEGIENEGFGFLEGVMSFDNIWEEIIQSVSNSSDHPRVYIVSWNDHFFVLKVEHDAFYIIDSLGERLFEGCNQAYILKFDRETTIYNQVLDDIAKTEEIVRKTEEKFEVLCRGKESCKEYIKNFLAAIPVRQIQVDVKKGLMDSTLVHQRLQIEFHFIK